MRVKARPVPRQLVPGRGAKLVWSPLSNLLLYGKTTAVYDALAAGVLVSLGTDWTPSGSANLLAEFARHIQFIVVTHNRATMDKADAMYGVSMDAEGVSHIFSMRPRNVAGSSPAASSPEESLAGANAGG